MPDPALEYLDRRTRVLDRRSLLRPLSTPELLDFSARTYRALGTTILRDTAAPMAMCYTVLVFFFVFVFPNLFTTRNAGDMTVQTTEVATVLAVGLLIALPLMLIGLSYTTALVTRLAADFLLGNEIDVRSSRLAARKSLWAALGVNLRTLFLSLLTLLVSLGFLLLSAWLNPQSDSPMLIVFGMVAAFGIVFGFLAIPIVASRFALAPSVVVLEGLKPSSAARRAVSLCRCQGVHPSGYDAFAAIWGLCLVLALFVGFGTMVGLSVVEIGPLTRSWLGGGAFANLAAQAIELLPWYLALWIIIPMWSTITTILYFDRRIRLEGYDIELLEQDVRRASRTSRFLF